MKNDEWRMQTVFCDKVSERLPHDWKVQLLNENQ